MPESRHIQAAATGSFGGRVGHKAGGFISKKFFHPSNFKNQEKLWQAIESKNEMEKRQEELQKKREEERRVELLKQEMYSSTGKAISSSATGGGLFANLSGPVSVAASTSLPPERNSAVQETKRRLDALKNTKRDSSTTKLSIKSRYAEDVHVLGHSSVWGSFFDKESKMWGYNCCQGTQRDSPCQLEVNDAPPSKKVNNIPHSVEF